MKKLFAFLLAALMVVSFAACGKNDAGNKDAANTDDREPAAEQEAGSGSAQPEEPDGTGMDDNALIEDAVEKLVGEWICPSVDEERLTFSKDGTGTYKGIFDKDYTFKYSVNVQHGAYGNGAEYADIILKINYHYGDSEEITVRFEEENGLKMTFHSGDSGYSGVMNYIDAWTKA